MFPVVGQMVRLLLLVNLSLTTAMLAAGPVAAVTSTNRPIRIAAFGDSLTAGYGLRPSEAFPNQLQRLLEAKGYQLEIANAGVSGDTTQGGLQRLAWAVPDGVDAVILELGANDALRGVPPARVRANLDKILASLKARNIEVLVAGMRAPRNLGNDYANAFDVIFPELAAKYDALLYPFFLTGVVLDTKLNLSDGVHPSAKGIGVIAERMAPLAEQLIARVKAKHRSASPGSARPAGTAK